MDYFGLVLAIAGKLQSDFSDKELTVKELIDLLSSTAEDLGYLDYVVLDLRKNKDKKENG